MLVNCEQTKTHCSQSFLECKDNYACFYGILDTKTLGGAGFASQRTTGDNREWDLSDYVGVCIDIKAGDSTFPNISYMRDILQAVRLITPAEKRYTFILKDELRPPDETTGREQSTISWECDFELPSQTKPGKTHDRSVFIPWDSLNPTYRGKLKKDVDPLNTKKIKRMSIMMRRYETSQHCTDPFASCRLIFMQSFFGAQEGDFSLSMKQISALSKVPTTSAFASDTKDSDIAKLENGGPSAKRQPESYGAETGALFKVCHPNLLDCEQCY